MEQEALFYEKINGKVKCFLCPHNCLIANERYGLCSVRKNSNGILKTINYGEITSIAEDPIEKKPLYHFKPGKNILSVGSFGCNFSCDFCQNHSISQGKTSSQFLSPEQLIEICISIDNNVGLAFTYNEPSIWYEYIFDTARKLKELYPEQKIVLVTNGYIQLEPLEKLLPYVDAMNIDLKSFQQEYYKKRCMGDLESVLKTIEASYQRCHLEITTLMVNDLNDSKEEIQQIASFIANLDKNIPLHLTRYYPAYKLELPPTDIEKLLIGKEVANRYLNYVYLGNIDNIDNSTYCPTCGELLIERRGYLSKIYISNNECPKCRNYVYLQ